MQSRHAFAIVLGLAMILWGLWPAFGAPPRVWVTAITGDLTPTHAELFGLGLEAAKKAGVTELHVFIDSPGGAMAAGFAIGRALKTSGIRSRCVVTGEAASAAFLVLQACDRRVATKHAVLATHQPYLMLPLAPGAAACFVNVETLVEAAHHLAATVAVHNGLVAARLGLSLAAYGAKVAEGRVWLMTPAEALAARAVDEVLP